MIFPYIQVRRINLYVVSRDCLMHRISPDYHVYTTVFKPMQQKKGPKPLSFFDAY